MINVSQFQTFFCMVGVLSASGWQYVTGERIMVEFTSFKKSIELPDRVKRYSEAVYQPKGFNYPKLDFFDIRKNGWWIRPRLYAEDPNPLMSYRETLMNAYIGRQDDIIRWIYDRPDYVALCCWCPYEKAAQRQIREHGNFVCHTEVIGGIIKTLAPETHIIWDYDRRTQMKRLWTKNSGVYD